jgi:hypothetical protein
MYENVHIGILEVAVRARSDGISTNSLGFPSSGVQRKAEQQSRIIWQSSTIRRGQISKNSQTALNI